MLFPYLVLCGDIEQQMNTIGNSRFFAQIVEKLKELNNVAFKWKEGAFSYKAINREHPLVISPESEQTMNQYGNLRTFSLPDDRREIFELHVKTGELRFHFYPDNDNRIIYVGYIGPHLSTVKYK
jgi:hypothetical protein